MQTLLNPLSLAPHLPAGRETVALFVMSACPYCRAFRPRFEAFAAGGAGGRGCLTVILDDLENPLWETYGVEVVPTLIVFEGREVKARRDGRPGQGLGEKDLEGL